MFNQTASKPFLSYSRPCVDEADIRAVVRVLRSQYLTTGPCIKDFEKALADCCAVPWAAVVNSGTAALHLALKALGIGAGDWVVVPAITFLTTANAVRLCGAEVIFADVDPDSGLMGEAQLQDVLEKEKNKNIKAVIPVYLAGQMDNVAAIARLIRARGGWVVEDACHALGAEYQGYPIGSCHDSDMAVFSFHAVKTVAMGEGGAITTASAELYQRIVEWRNHGMRRARNVFIHEDRACDSQGRDNAWYYEMHEVGWNYRVSDIHCALGLSQLQKLSQFVRRRQWLADYYDQLLVPLAPLVRPILRTGYGRPAWHLYSVLIDFAKIKKDRGYVMRALQAEHIGTQVHYIPVSTQPYYERRYGVAVLPGAERYYARTLSLPLYPDLSAEDVERVVHTLKTIVME
ncbi:MAG: UDP-4-amino-4,6-dideoxy-N-acetyl-beta-L-altrosamine transaminase [Coxiella sp. RIFCSPHIGHO2_12_FULL_44_14]|nr:MAG: UDP-4-amino-4,6-dideoxy-N-acetyl-beta-L-altrosamine transaminase [Coxiella sp. RIFCSPHIGHO2_12_FULL_44_14]